jgi:hypothetical protein
MSDAPKPEPTERADLATAGLGPAERKEPVPLALALFVFLGAFLLFALEPMVGRVLLPRFGGAFHVWTTSLMFFQGALVLAYGYAHVLAKRLGAWHFVVLALPLAFFPIGEAPLDAMLGPSAASEEVSIGALLVALARTSLGPFFALATTSVLAQDWLSRSPIGKRTNAYVLYSVSNVGSLVALFVYALVIEPLIGLRVQSWLLAGAYALYVGAAALSYARTRPHVPARHVELGAGSASVGTQLRWVLLSAWPSAILMAVTNVVTVDAGNVPLLWILPLATYLLTFILAFSDQAATPDWVRRVWPHFADGRRVLLRRRQRGLPALPRRPAARACSSWCAGRCTPRSTRAGPTLDTSRASTSSSRSEAGSEARSSRSSRRSCSTGLWEYPIAFAGLAITMAAGKWEALRGWVKSRRQGADPPHRRCCSPRSGGSSPRA